MRKNFIFPALFAGLFLCFSQSCSKEEGCIITDKGEKKAEMLSFFSKSSLEDAIDGYGVVTKSGTSAILEESLLSPIENSRFVSDPILSVECSMLNIDPTSQSGSVFDVLGYDELVPNESFANLLNIRGEVEVQDTIYKVSPKGTYYFHKSDLNSFENNYRTISASELLPIGAGLYKVIFDNQIQVDGDIYLKDTFENSCDVYNDGVIGTSYEDENESNNNVSPVTKGNIDDRWTEALDFDWNSFDKHYTDAHTWAGELIQGVIGRNVSFEKEFDSKHRLKAKLYYYDYAVYSEIGALSKMQKKNWIGWSETDAQKIYQIWSNIVIWTPFQKTVKYPHVQTGSSIPREYLGTNVEDIPGTGERGVVSYFAGRDLSEQELKAFASKSYINSVIDLKINVDRDRLDSRTVAAKYVTEKGIYTIIYPYGKMVENKGEIQSKFSKDFHISLGFSLTPGSLPNDFMGWLQSASAEKLKAPELTQGEIMTAAKYNGAIKGMRLIKQHED